MSATPWDIITLMRLAERIRRPLRRYEDAVRTCTRTYTDSDENNAAQERGNAALREVRHAVREWVAVYDQGCVRAALEAVMGEEIELTEIQPDPYPGWVKIFCQTYREAGPS